MHTRYLLITSAALAIASTAGAEPAKPEVPAAAAQPTDRAAEVVMASAEQVRTPTATSEATPTAGETPTATPVKRPRAARVTTCRCAGQTQH